MFDDQSLDLQAIPFQHQSVDSGQNQRNCAGSNEKNTSEKSNESQQEEIDPAKLLKKFRHRKIKNKSSKNLPKHFLRILFREMYKVDDEIYIKKLEKLKTSINKKSKNRVHLDQVFGKGNNPDHSSETSTSRALVQESLAQDKAADVLKNNMIPHESKLNYLLFSKIYEWRLSDPELVDRFTP